ncbi:endolytic transglycosylase MltG [Nocardioides caeni]|uniref:Endolytic murein transglycosylase n=1 Tax=Nocardioides caeni TaxID=574700 RepID=A0A4S8NAI3_9ACTN|nr:endolytic transglycosylase MltG [Nocardioides caeni]THV13333.1 endolytic transglycosylase MltG [Nocardioides caeni]
MRPVHVALRDLVTEHGEGVLEDDRALATALDPIVVAGEVSPDQSEALVTAVRLGGFERLISLLQGGADIDGALRSASTELADQRPDGDGSAARWALSVLAFTVDLVPDEQIPLWLAARPAPPLPAEDEVDLGFRDPSPGAGRARKRRSGCLPVLLVAVLFVAVLGWFGRGMIADVKDMFAGPEDFPGPGSGEVSMTVDPGQSIPSMGAELEELGVVASAEAFVDAANAKPDQMIQAATFLLKKEMKAADAFAYMADPANAAAGDPVTVPEGFTVEQIVARLVDNTDFPARAFRRALADPASIGLPDYAGGNPEGYLFPATYTFGPDDKPADMLAAMVRRYEQALGDNDIEQVGASLGAGYTPEEIMTVASLVEAEGRGEDMAKIARAIYNRLELPAGGGTNGLLQIDASVLYALGTRDTDQLVAPLADVIDSPYNTYRYAGLPPGPIGAPGEQAIQAALNPAEGDWIYWVTVDCAGTTEFSSSLEEHNQHDAVNGAEC